MYSNMGAGQKVAMSDDNFPFTTATAYFDP